MPITAPATSDIAQPVRDWAWAHTLAGPLAFGLMLALPVESLTYPIRCSFGLLLWTAWWWVFRPVHLAVTGLLPLAVVAVFNFVPVAEILPHGPTRVSAPGRKQFFLFVAGDVGAAIAVEISDGQRM